MAGNTLRRYAHSQTIAVALAMALGIALLAVGVGFAPAVADEDEEVVAEFEALGTEGFVEINSEELDDPIDLPEPDEVEDPILVAGEIYDDGTWFAAQEDIVFPTIEEGVPVDLELEAATDFTGEIDRDSGVMTLDGTLRIILSEDDQIDVEAELTTEQSGEMEGSADGLDTDSATVTVVDNEFVIPTATSNPIVNSVVGLPSNDPGTNWFSVTFDMDIMEPTDPEDLGTVSGVVTDAEGIPIEDATVEAGGEETTTDANGAYEFDVPGGERDLTVSADGFDAETVSIDVLADDLIDVDAIELTETEFGTISGIVTDAEGNPVEGATVSAADEQTTTDADGAYELTAPAGTQEISISGDEFETETASVDVVAEGVTDVDDIALAPLDVGEAEFQAASITGDDVEPGETVFIEAELINVGEAPGEQDVTVTVADQSTTETVSLDPFEEATVTLEWETTEDDVGDHQATLETDDDSVSTTVVVGEPDIDVDAADFVARSTGGYITFAVDSYAEIVDGFGVDSIETTDDAYAAFNNARGDDDLGNGLALPDINAGEEPIVLAGNVDWDEGTWELVDSFFPALEDPAYPFDGFIELPDESITGEINRDDGRMTAETTFDVFVDGRLDAMFTFDITMTTDDSGDIPTGMADIGPDQDEGAVHLVSNDFIVDDQTGDGIIDSEMNLPSTTPGENYMELGFEVTFDPDEEDLEDIGGDDDQQPIGDRQLDDDSLFVDAGLGLGAIGFLVAAFFVGTALLVRVRN